MGWAKADEEPGTENIPNYPNRKLGYFSGKVCETWDGDSQLLYLKKELHSEYE